MARTLILYGLVLGFAATFLNWFADRYLARAFPTEIYVSVLAAGFVLLGIWVGRSLTPRRGSSDFQRNEAAIRSLGLSPREMEILGALVSGESNKELARRLGISPNTVKTHINRVYDKLDVERRIQAIEKARMLELIP
jgi:DNA-binding CsgD family transcriptional regulator